VSARRPSHALLHPCPAERPCSHTARERLLGIARLRRPCVAARGAASAPLRDARLPSALPRRLRVGVRMLMWVRLGPWPGSERWWR